ncbi:single-stranded DNA-binding protein [Myroides ceti]|uniref:Single-stranded DNA-binding protein n=1 Tax=Paenimyroides ceti TaxID=395087 RepID=A0ABT8CVB9_9FLAO|nr:single-stranded DNA-binding protein [Paenimyroides ceti]MDN3708134.1 single-stranded DNA-binding protein [Paenimyroides ceti]
MLGTLNKVTLIGHLGDEVKMHYFEGGNSIARFSIATNEVYINKTTNEKITSTEWHNIVVRNKAAELCEKYLSKGDKIYIEGKIRTRHWQTEEGLTKHTSEIQATEFIFLNTKKEVDVKNKKHTDEEKFSDFDVPKISDFDNENLPF